MEVNPNCDVASICGGEATNADVRLTAPYPCHFSGWIIQPHFINNLNLLCFTIFQSSLQVMNGSQNTNPDKPGTRIFLEYLPWRKQGSRTWLLRFQTALYAPEEVAAWDAPSCKYLICLCA
jgi:hypothetical protein